jgi:hypothetical protein
VTKGNLVCVLEIDADWDATRQARQLDLNACNFNVLLKE